jgi:general bacterial porin, GBP family
MGTNYFFKALLFTSVCWASLVAGAAAEPPLNRKQSTIILYGIVDTGVGYTTTSAPNYSQGVSAQGTRFGMSSGAQSGSRWGLRVIEQFDSQTKLVAILEQGLFSNNGELAQNGVGFGRQSTLGFENENWGRLDFGMQTNLASNYFLGVDPFVLGFGQANMGASFGSADTFRYSNMLLYQTPSKHTWQLGIGYSFGLNVSSVYLNSANPSVIAPTSYFSNVNNLRALTLGARYRNKLITLVASFDVVQAPKNIPVGNTPYPLVPNSDSALLKEWILGVSFKTSAESDFIWAAAVGQGFNGAFSGQTPGNNFTTTGLPTDTLNAQILFASGYNTNSYMLGVTWQIDPVQKIFASWQAMQPNMNIPTIAPLAFAQTLSMAYTYNFTPRTNLYTWTSAGNNFQLFSGNKAFEVGVGLRHLF